MRSIEARGRGREHVTKEIHMLGVDRERERVQQKGGERGVIPEMLNLNTNYRH